MSAIVAVLYEASPVRWREFHLHGRLLPAHLMRDLLPHFQRWVDYLRPITRQGNLVGLWVSSRMSPRRWSRLRALAEPLLVSADEAKAAASPVGNEMPSPRVLSLSRCGLHIPRRNVNHAQEILGPLGDIEITCDDDLNGEALLIPAGTSLNGMFSALEIAVEPLEDGSTAGRKQRLDRLRQEIRNLDPRAA